MISNVLAGIINYNQRLIGSKQNSHRLTSTCDGSRIIYQVVPGNDTSFSRTISSRESNQDPSSINGLEATHRHQDISKILEQTTYSDILILESASQGGDELPNTLIQQPSPHEFSSKYGSSGSSLNFRQAEDSVEEELPEDNHDESTDSNQEDIPEINRRKISKSKKKTIKATREHLSPENLEKVRKSGRFRTRKWRNRKKLFQSNDTILDYSKNRHETS
ncbi:hypothetical protein QAD02_003904 [Eretmocerus hayati]|uniref:Uncharacterized protein n=1 Tax=Eretmocerus hayati TaxID=131215 RepID=A0ACC2NSY1_9HYME|nr:hypothetical protein QAD02_003904 [Eretmocerus hayati]